MKTDFDFIIVGSGFGGAVAAHRLTQKGYSVAIVEKGRRYRREDFPKTNWSLKRFLWAPVLRCFGIQQISMVKGVMVLHGAGLGGGSLVYANTLMKPRAQAFLDPRWPQGIDWEKELEPYYKEAQRMLGVTENQIEQEADRQMFALAQKLGVQDTYHRTQVGVFFAPPGCQPGQEVADPFFAGQGPSRAGCTGCGGCMIGCRVGAKNTLDQNYLYFAEKNGAQVFTETRAVEIKPLAGPEPFRYELVCESTTVWFWQKSTQRKRFRAKNIILSAGVMGTLELLFKNKCRFQNLPKLSETLGDFVRTNGESLCGATSFDKTMELSQGVAIGSAIHVDEHTKIEPVRYPPGSNALRLLAVPLTGAGTPLIRSLKMFLQMIVRFPQVLKLYTVSDWARQTVILLVMQSRDEKMKLKWGRSLLSGFRQALVADPSNMSVPSYIPVAQEASKILAKQIGGEPQNIISEVLLGIPATAHILGGATMADSPQTGVCDFHHEVFHYPGLYVCDGSVIPANLGVNPSLTITALAERFSQHFPQKR